jgi:hypothetical protein
MHPEDLLKPDLLSRSVLVGAGAVIAVTLLVIVIVVYRRGSLPL